MGGAATSLYKRLGTHRGLDKRTISEACLGEGTHTGRCYARLGREGGRVLLPPCGLEGPVEAAGTGSGEPRAGAIVAEKEAGEHPH